MASEAWSQRIIQKSCSSKTWCPNHPFVYEFKPYPSIIGINRQGEPFEAPEKEYTFGTLFIESDKEHKKYLTAVKCRGWIFALFKFTKAGLKRIKEKRGDVATSKKMAFVIGLDLATKKEYTFCKIKMNWSLDSSFHDWFNSTIMTELSDMSLPAQIEHN